MKRAGTGNRGTCPQPRLQRSLLAYKIRILQAPNVAEGWQQQQGYGSFSFSSVIAGKVGEGGGDRCRYVQRARACVSTLLVFCRFK